MLGKVTPRWVGLVTSCLFGLAWGCGSSTGTDEGLSMGGGPSGSGGSTSSAGSASVVAGTTAAGGTATSTAGTAGSTASGGTAVSTSGGAGSGDLPCDVQQLLATKCLLCHQVDPPGLMQSAADFQKMAKSDPSKTVGQLAVERLQATGAMRMPPAPLPAATADEIAALTAWVQAGATPEACGSTTPVAPSPYDTPLTCTSMSNWTGGNRESPLMRPGGACIDCHSKGEGPRLAIGGTVYPSAHEPDDCNGAGSASGTNGAQVVITDAGGTEHTLDVNAAGNFMLETRNFAYPYQAKVVYQGRERVMVEAQQSGDCNLCHTQDGTQNAPGRIMLP